MDCVESIKLSEAQNWPANALVNLVHDLSTSWTFSEKIADTLAPIADDDFGGNPQCCARHTPLESENSSSSSSCSSISSPMRLKQIKKKLWKMEFCSILAQTLRHTIRKVKFLSTNSILTKLYNFLGKSKLSITKECKSPTFSRVFHPILFWQFFLWNQSCQQLKSPKPQHFHEFSPKKIFLGKSKLNFWTKNEDFE